MWWILRLEALFGITVTGVVYSTLLRGIVDLHGAASVTDALLHYVSPIMVVLGWLLFGPRPRVTQEHPRYFPDLASGMCRLLFRLRRATDWYPYPYPCISVTHLGYATVIRSGTGLNLLLIGVGALYMWFDHHLPGADTNRHLQRGFDSEKIPERPS